MEVSRELRDVSRELREVREVGEVTQHVHRIRKTENVTRGLELTWDAMADGRPPDSTR